MKEHLKPVFSNRSLFARLLHYKYSAICSELTLKPEFKRDRKLGDSKMFPIRLWSAEGH